MTAHKTVLLEGQARDDAAELERLKAIIATDERLIQSLKKSPLTQEEAEQLQERAERAEAERDAVSNRLQRALEAGANLRIERDALLAVINGAELMLGCASLGKPDYYVISKAAIDAAMRKRNA